MGEFSAQLWKRAVQVLHRFAVCLLILGVSFSMCLNITFSIKLCICFNVNTVFKCVMLIKTTLNLKSVCVHVYACVCVRERDRDRDRVRDRVRETVGL